MLCYIKWTAGTWADTLTVPAKCSNESKTSIKESPALPSPFAFQAVKDLSPGKEHILGGFFFFERIITSVMLSVVTPEGSSLLQENLTCWQHPKIWRSIWDQHRGINHVQSIQYWAADGFSPCGTMIWLKTWKWSLQEHRSRFWKNTSPTPSPCMQVCKFKMANSPTPRTPHRKPCFPLQ